MGKKAFLAKKCKKKLIFKIRFQIDSPRDVLNMIFAL
jgi:hypothetical protein